jgi:predicted kinase
MSKPYVITFAGVPGSSKSIIAHYLSINFSLPIFSTDNIRYEVKEDLLVSDINEPKASKEYNYRQNKRFQDILELKKNFILDGSVDRRWQEVKNQLNAAGYNWCLIDMELSRDFMINLYTKTNRPRAIEELDAYLVQHANFMKKYSSDVKLKITDQLFKDRNSIAEKTVRKFIDNPLR